MIIIRKDKLELVDPNSEIMRTPLKEFDFSEHAQQDIDMLVNVLKYKMIELGGVGLSANQLGLPYRLFVMGIPEYNGAFFNSTILRTEGEPETFKEGCLSYRGIFMQIKRPPVIFVQFQNSVGEVKQRIFSGLTARVFQHEYEHMQGLDFTLGVSKLKLKIAQEKYQRNKKRLINQHALATMKKALVDTTL